LNVDVIQTLLPPGGRHPPNDVAVSGDVLADLAVHDYDLAASSPAPI
jgi:hypothetical protein